MTRNNGIPNKEPANKSMAKVNNNPFNWSLSLRGKLFEGVVIQAKGKTTVTIQKESQIYFTKFKRYGRSKNRIHAHVPSNLDIKEGDHVIAAECRPISKSVSFVVVEVKE